MEALTARDLGERLGSSARPIFTVFRSMEEVQQETRKAIKTAISTTGLVLFFVVSFVTQAWYVTWLIFPISAAVQGVITACMDLKEAKKHEN